MSTLTPAQIAAVAYRAGFRGQGLTRAVAVALAESGGRTDATNTNTDSHRSVDRGLWQINSYWHKEVSAAAAFDPNQAAAHAYRISSRGTNWSQWATWNNGSAAAQLPRATMGVAAMTRQATNGGTSQVFDLTPWDGLFPDGMLERAIPDDGLKPDLEDVPVLGDAATSMRQLVTMLTLAGSWISDPHNWLRVGMVVGGGAGLLIAADMLAKSGAAGSTAARVAATTKGAAKGAAVMAVTKGKA